MFKKLAVVASGTAIAQLVTFGVSPFLSRLYSPSDFGFLGAALSLSSILAVVGHGRLNLAIGLPKSSRVAQSLFVFSSFLCLFFSLVVGVVVFFCVQLGLLPSHKDSYFFPFLVAAMTYCTGQIDLMSYWQGRCRRFDLTAKNSIFRSLATAGFQLSLSKISLSGLALGALCGAGLSVLSSFHGMRLRSLILSRSLVYYFRTGWWCVKRYKKFPLFSMPQGLLASLGLNSAPLILGFFFGSAAVGQYWLAYRILVAPIALLGNAYRQVSLSQIGSESLDFQSKRAASIKHTAFLAIGGLTVFLILWAKSVDIFVAFFGRDWALAGQISAWLALAFMADLTKMPSTTLIHYLGLHKEFLHYELILSASRIVALFVSAYFFGFYEAVMIFSVIGCCAAVSLVFWALRQKKRL